MQARRVVTEKICPNERVEEITTDISPDGFKRFLKYGIKGDGMCGYHSFARWMSDNRPDDYEDITLGQTGDEPLRKWLQDYIIQIVTLPSEKVRQAVCHDTGEGASPELLDDILKRAKEQLLRSRKEWMSRDELFLLCCFFRVKAHVYLNQTVRNSRSGKDQELKRWDVPINPQKVEGVENTIYLYNNGSHYDLLVPLPNDEVTDVQYVRTQPVPQAAPPRRKRRSKTPQRNTAPKEEPEKEPDKCDGEADSFCTIQLQNKPLLLKF